MIAPWLLERLTQAGDDVALVWQGAPTTYAALVRLVEQWRVELAARQVKAGTVVALEGSFSPNSCAALIALVQLGAIAVPLTPLMRAHREKFLEISQAQVLFELDPADGWTAQSFDRPVTHPLLQKLLERGSAGLVIFSSGSSGQPKAVLHDFGLLLEKFLKRGHKKTTLSFLLFDHIGGIDTLFNTLAHGGTLVTGTPREPEKVCEAIAKFRVHTLPTSPTFLNLLLISDAWTQHDLSSLEVIAYGTEPMPQSTLARLHQAFPKVTLVQTYGMSELGVLRSRSKDSQSLWLKFTGEGFQTKVVDSVLWVKAATAMLGYLNAPELVDAEGWLNTQDSVEVDGEYLRILGRASELINVGGQKVYPAEVESQLLELENVREVTVFGKPHPMMGQIVAARFTLETDEPLAAFKRRMNDFCRERLARFQIPIFVELTQGDQFGTRFKKLRRGPE